MEINDQISDVEIGTDTDVVADAPASADAGQAETKGGRWQQYIDGNVPDPKSTIDADEIEKVLTDDDAPDEKIPDAGAEDDADPAEKAEADKEAKKPRSKNHADILAQNTELEATIAEKDAAIAERDATIAEINLILDGEGATAENLLALKQNSEIFLDPEKHKEAVDYIRGLPQGETIAQGILNTYLNVGDAKLDAKGEALALNNRIFVLNHSLQKDFGLKSPLKPEMVNLILQNVANRLNHDTDEALDDWQAELDLLKEAETPAEKSAREANEKADRLQKDLDALKNKDSGQATEEKPLEPEEIAAKYDAFESSVFTEVIGDVLKDFNVGKFEDLNATQQEAFTALIRFKLGSSPVFAQAAHYVLAGNEKHANFAFLKGQYRNSVRATLRTIATDLLGKPKAQPKPAAKVDDPLKPQPKQSTPTGKAPLAPSPKPEAKGVNRWSQVKDGTYGQ